MGSKSEYEDNLNQRWEKISGEMVRGEEEEWRIFKEEFLEVDKEVCMSYRIKNGKEESGVNSRVIGIRRTDERKN